MNNQELAYIDLKNKLPYASSNNSYLKLYDGFKALGGYRDSNELCIQILNKLTFSNADELMYLGKKYLDFNLFNSVDIGERCISLPQQWKSYENDYAQFCSKYGVKPKLWKLWERFSTIIIIAGIVTLLWAFIIYFGALLVEFIFRIIYTGIGRLTKNYKQNYQELTSRKQKIDAEIYKLQVR